MMTYLEEMTVSVQNYLKQRAVLMADTNPTAAGVYAVPVCEISRKTHRSQGSIVESLTAAGVELCSTQYNNLGSKPSSRLYYATALSRSRSMVELAVWRDAPLPLPEELAQMVFGQISQQQRSVDVDETFSWIMPRTLIELKRLMRKRGASGNLDLDAALKQLDRMLYDAWMVADNPLADSVIMRKRRA